MNNPKSQNQVTKSVAGATTCRASFINQEGVLEKAARIGLGDAIVERYGCDVKVLVDACDVDGVYDVEEEDSDDDTLVLHKERLQENGVTVPANSLHPGVINTNPTRNDGELLTLT
ncbi:hypothetical protein Tco_0386491 [Tanacetum coccineum]